MWGAQTGSPKGWSKWKPVLHEADDLRLHGAAWDQPCFFALRAFTALADFPRELEPAGMIRSRTR